MVIDEETNTVLYSDKLDKGYPDFCKTLVELLLNQGLTIKQVNRTGDIWCRDYLPVQVSRNRFVQFVHNPSGLSGAHDPPPETSKLHLPVVPVRSKLILDGGNVVRWKNKAIVTDVVYEQNPERNPKEIENILKVQLQLEDLIVIPFQPHDIFRQAHGMVRFLDEHTVLVNNYDDENDFFRKKLSSVLRKKNVETVPFAYYDGGKHLKESAAGCYINYLHAGSTIILPEFGHALDEQAFRSLEKLYPRHTIYTLPCNEIAKSGGMLNCVTWNIML
jgi:agmatine deiminase